MGKKKEEQAALEQQQQEIRRTKTPRGREVYGLIEQRLGGNRMRVRCLDGKIRVCRIPGRLKRKLWVRERDICIIEPWEYLGDEKGDIVFKYRPTQVNYLRQNGQLKELEQMEEF